MESRSGLSSRVNLSAGRDARPALKDVSGISARACRECSSDRFTLRAIVNWYTAAAVETNTVSQFAAALSRAPVAVKAFSDYTKRLAAGCGSFAAASGNSGCNITVTPLRW
jgi:hypothetical protein